LQEEHDNAARYCADYHTKYGMTKRCTIVNQKPTTTNVVQIGPLAFKTRTEAEAGMKTIKVCETR
jgi:hypothetical protein